MIKTEHSNSKESVFCLPCDLPMRETIAAKKLLVSLTDVANEILGLSYDIK